MVKRVLVVLAMVVTVSGCSSSQWCLRDDAKARPEDLYGTHYECKLRAKYHNKEDLAANSGMTFTPLGWEQPHMKRREVYSGCMDHFGFFKCDKHGNEWKRQRVEDPILTRDGHPKGQEGLQ